MRSISAQFADAGAAAAELGGHAGLDSPACFSSRVVAGDEAVLLVGLGGAGGEDAGPGEGAVAHAGLRSGWGRLPTVWSVTATFMAVILHVWRQDAAAPVPGALQLPVQELNGDADRITGLLLIGIMFGAGN